MAWQRSPMDSSPMRWRARSSNGPARPCPGGRIPRDRLTVGDLTPRVSKRRPDPKLPLRDGPEVDGLAVRFDGLLRLPLAHVEVVRDDAGAGSQLLHQHRLQLLVEARQEIQRDD